jgi:hypothetical protein
MPLIGTEVGQPSLPRYGEATLDDPPLYIPRELDWRSASAIDRL